MRSSGPTSAATRRSTPASSPRASRPITCSGESPETTAQARWQGAFDDSYNVRDLGADGGAYSSRCGGGKNLMITTALQVDGPAGAEGVLDVDSIDGEVHHLSWTRCSH